MQALARLVHGRIHYAWITTAVAFFIMLVTAATRATPSVMLTALEQHFGWSLPEISAALSINLLLFGLMGPFAAASMARFGLRLSVIAAMILLGSAVAVSSLMRTTWQLWLLWGLVVGCASGVTSTAFGATIVSRWFKERRGLAMGLLTASTATGQLAFLPILASMVDTRGWQPAVLIVAAAIFAIVPIAYLLLPERPASVRLPLYGEPPDAPLVERDPPRNPIAMAFGVLARAIRNRDFWLLFASFFVCGASTNGYIGTHFIAMCGDHGMTAVEGAGILAAMGLLDLIGTTGSGWMADRFNNRKLLFWYYGLRGLSLLYLPFAFNIHIFGIPVFALFYGLDWIATVPPTLRLTTDAFGPHDAPIVFGWIFSGHQLGAAFAALGAGFLRHELGSYTAATLVSGLLCLVAAIIVLRISPRKAAVAA